MYFCARTTRGIIPIPTPPLTTLFILITAAAAERKSSAYIPLLTQQIVIEDHYLSDVTMVLRSWKSKQDKCISQERLGPVAVTSKFRKVKQC